MLDWLIIGGGVQGTHLSLVLTTKLGVPRERLRVLDPHARPMQRWRDCVAATGMRYLRSPSVHHIGLEPFELLDFAEAIQLPGAFTAPYNRPSVELFHRHCGAVRELGALDGLRVRGRALSLRPRPGGYSVETEDGRLDAHRVVLALGASERPLWPGWALGLLTLGVDVQHVFDPAFSPGRRFEGPVLVVGGGMSGVQVALRLVEAGEHVTLWSRHATRVHQFDSDPGWIGRKHMRGFSRISDPDRRRAILAAARHGGSITPQLAARLRRAEAQGAPRRVVGSLRGARALGGGLGALLELSETQVSARHVLLCTGFDPARPGGAMLDDAVDAMELRCAACGYPVPGPNLEWAPGLFVMGPLAELELGPTARNITGGRRGAERIAAA